ncbi:MAG: AbrB/MazE/SpoVT family DNA-binding domain-containing protein [Nitrososphaerota archaeon]|nr:AbrB/MazE/SpoVT family DNA-binding domain-containing protein [Candidatus Calditenuaceae archaeon]MDW8073818.1 AbrB/MazE/SpoVT family DNA-binding domain-containing protein [Nitrososphaerota archaeon]
MPKLEERRLQQLRGSSYVLTLPKEWVEELGLGKGSSVFLLTEPGLLIVVPGERVGGLLVDVELDVVGEERLENVVKVLYRVGASQVRFRTRKPVHEVVGKIRRLRREIHGLIVTAPSENLAVVSFSDEVFAGLDQGIRVFLMTLASAAQVAAKPAGQVDAGSLQEELADCRLYALALFRHVSGLITKPSRDMVIQALPLTGVVSARMLDLCDSFENAVASGVTGVFTGLVGVFSELVAEMTDALGGDFESFEKVEKRVKEALVDIASGDCRAYMLFKSLLNLAESLKELALLKTIITA